MARHNTAVNQYGCWHQSVSRRRQCHPPVVQPSPASITLCDGPVSVAVLSAAGLGWFPIGITFSHLTPQAWSDHRTRYSQNTISIGLTSSPLTREAVLSRHRLLGHLVNVKTRFIGALLPGPNLRTSAWSPMWKESDNGTDAYWDHTSLVPRWSP